jgi:mannose-1-phosphate guanylyltransferase
MAGTTGIILAGTYPWGNRVFDRLPRPLLPVAQTPLIRFTLEWLREGGIPAATICANGAIRIIETFLGQGPRLPLDLDYYEDRTPRGAAGCARDAALLTDADTFVVADGAIVPVVDLQALLASHRRSRAAVTVVVHEGDAAQGAGTRPPRPAGIYVFERRALDCVPKTGFQDIKEDLIPRLYRAGEKVVAYAVPGACLRVMTPESYLAVNEWMVERVTQHPRNAEGYRVEGTIFAHPTAIIHPEATLVGPLLIGPLVQVGARAAVVGPASLGPETTIAARALVSRTVTWDRCTVGEGAVLDRCVLADDTVVEPRARLSHVIKGPRQSSRLSASLLRGRRTDPKPAYRWEPYPTLTPALRPVGGSLERARPDRVGLPQEIRGPLPV